MPARRNRPPASVTTVAAGFRGGNTAVPVGPPARTTEAPASGPPSGSCTTPSIVPDRSLTVPAGISTGSPLRGDRTAATPGPDASGPRCLQRRPASPRATATSTTAPIPSFAFVPSAIRDPPFASHAGSTGRARSSASGSEQRRPGLALAPVLIVEPLAQPLHALGQPPAHGARRQPQLPGNVRGAPALVVAQQDRRPVGLVELHHRFRQRPVHLGPFQQFLGRGRRRRRGRQFGSRPVVDALRPPALAGHIAQHRRQPGLGWPIRWGGARSAAAQVSWIRSSASRS